MSALDLKMWTQEGKESPQVLHTFYKKECASVYTILKRSAVSGSTKQSTCFQKSLRKLLHCSEDIPWTEISNHMTDCSQMFRVSGYNQMERYNWVKGAVERWKEMKSKVEQGEFTSMSRDRK